MLGACLTISKYSRVYVWVVEIFGSIAVCYITPCGRITRELNDLPLITQIRDSEFQQQNWFLREKSLCLNTCNNLARFILVARFQVDINMIIWLRQKDRQTDRENGRKKVGGSRSCHIMIWVWAGSEIGTRRHNFILIYPLNYWAVGALVTSHWCHCQLHKTPGEVESLYIPILKY